MPVEAMALSSPYPSAIADTSSHDPAAASTRSPPRIHVATRRAPPPTPQLSAPASQESIASGHSGQSSFGPRLQHSSSNVSQLTSSTDSASPTLAVPEQHHFYDQTAQVAAGLKLTRLRTPEQVNGVERTSPVHLASPLPANGTKRTASGHVKADASLPNTPVTSVFPGTRPRADSISSTGSRAGDLAVSLKTRLGYAMAKVHQGWENKNIHEVERLARQRFGQNRHSMSHLDYAGRSMTNGGINGHTPYALYESPSFNAFDQPSAAAYQPSKRHSGTYSSFVSASQPTLSTGPRLQPAVDLRPASSSQPHHHYYASTSPTRPAHANGQHAVGNMMSPPTTPVNGAAVRRPPTIRTQTQTAEAEREALQALFQLGSPRGPPGFATNTNASQVSSSQGSPLHSEFATPRTAVAFPRSESDGSVGHLSSAASTDRSREEGARELVEA